MSTVTEVREPEVQSDVQREIRRLVVKQVPQRPPMRVLPKEEFAARLFATALLETSGLQRRRRTLAAVMSFILQCSLLGVILIVPLMFTEALPKQQLLTFLLAAPPPPPPPPPGAAEATAKVLKTIQSDLMDGRLRTPTKIPKKVQMIREDEPPPAMSSGGVVGGVPGGIPGGQMGGVIGGIIISTANVAVVPKMNAPVAPKRLRISQGVTQGMTIHRVEPQYPLIARSAHIQGQVILSAVISKNGEIENLTLVSGHPMLVPAALDAVRQWRYRPYMLNGEPVEVETTITVTFELI